MEWTGGRMDDLAKRVDDGFVEVKGDIARLDAKFDAKIDSAVEGLRVDLKSDIARLDGGIDKLDAKISGLQTLLFRYALGTSTGILAGVVLVSIRALTTG